MATRASTGTGATSPSSSATATTPFAPFGVSDIDLEKCKQENYSNR